MVEISSFRRILRRPGRPPQPTGIAALRVLELFGKLNYEHIPITQPDGGSRVAVLYGDNGTGKTTILKLIYACLSWQPNAGLRTLLSETPFRYFSITLSDGAIIEVVKEDIVGSFKFHIKSSSSSEEFRIVASADNSVKEQESVTLLEQAIRRLNFDILFVDHNRIVQSTHSLISESFSGDLMAEWVKLSGPEQIYSFPAAIPARFKDKELRFPLLQVVDALNKKFRTEAYRQGAEGEQSAAGVYLEIVKSISKDRRQKTAAPPKRDVVETLSGLKSSTASFIRHGLLSEYPFDDFVSIYEKASKVKRTQIESVLVPFLDSIERRISALGEVHRRITVFEDELSKYFKHKYVRFSVSDGLTLSDSNGSIDLDALSSGEKQLVFLLCSAAVARSRRSIIIIDEPELSLNYKWQRLIAGSLGNISAGSGTQYILASHSIEIITRYVNSAYELVD